MRTWIRLFWLTAFVWATASARLGSVEIVELITYSDEIVIAKVTELLPTSTSERDLVYATATVQRTLKGSLAGTFLFRASPGVICDSSGAVKDETALFFLGRASDGTFYIYSAGRGRMPFREVNGKTYVSLWDEVLLPKDAPKIPGPDPKYGFINSVELPYLEAIIRKHAHDKAIYSGAG